MCVCVSQERGEAHTLDMQHRDAEAAKEELNRKLAELEKQLQEHKVCVCVYVCVGGG